MKKNKYFIKFGLLHTSAVGSILIIMSLLMVRNRRIKTLASVILIALSAYLFSRCEDENAQARSYPRVRTNPVSGITSDGATFNGDIYSLGTEQIINHGFVWSNSDYPDLTDSRVLLGPATKQGSYSAGVVTSLTKDVEYTVKSFVQTAEHIVYGQPVKFKSLGSGAPVVSGFSPDAAAWLDTVKISGKNFSYEVSRNRVKLNQALCTVITATDTLLIIEVSPLVSELKNLVSVEIEGNISVFTTDSLTFIPPELNDFFPKKAFWGDTLYLKGKHFKSFTSNSDNSVKLGTIKCERVGQVTDTVIAVKVPFELPDLRSDLIMKINGLTLLAKQQFELLPPYFTFSPKTGTWGTTITLSGRFNNKASLNTIYFNDNNVIYIKVQPEDILSTTINIIKIKVPSNIIDIKSTIIYEAEPFSVTSTDTFRLAAPVISSFSPATGPSGTSVTIKGKYFDVIAPEVFFGGLSAVITGVNDSVIVAIVPPDLTGNVKIAIKAKLQTAVSSGYFDVKNPKITGISPLSGTFNDEVTITGESFVSPTVSFEGIPATIKSSTATTIVVQVPIEIDSIPRALTVTSGANSISSTQKFTLSPPQIYSLSPGAPDPGSEITITGNNFNPVPELNTVLLDIYPMTVKSSSKTGIVATLPLAIPRGNFRIKVIVGGYTRLSSQSLTFSNSPWLRLAAPQIPSTFIDGYWGSIIYGQSSKNFGFVCSEEGGTTYRFDPNDNSWTQLSIASPFESYAHYVMMGQVVYKDSIYLIGGHYDNATKMLFAGNDSWKSLPSPAQRSGVVFSLNDKIYFGLDYWNPNLIDFYECNPGNNYSWTRLGDFPIFSGPQFSTYFTVGGKGYVVFSDNSVYQFDPSDLIWRRMADFPGSSRVLAFSFVLGNVAYIGGGQSSAFWDPQPNDLWRFDPVSNIWSLMSDIPGIRHSAVAFSIGTKAYIGFGLKNQDGYRNNLYDFYEYDPNYPAK